MSLRGIVLAWTEMRAARTLVATLATALAAGPRRARPRPWSATARDESDAFVEMNSARASPTDNPNWVDDQHVGDKGVQHPQAQRTA